MSAAVGACAAATPNGLMSRVSTLGGQTINMHAKLLTALGLANSYYIPTTDDRNKYGRPGTRARMHVALASFAMQGWSMQSSVSDAKLRCECCIDRGCFASNQNARMQRAPLLQDRAVNVAFRALAFASSRIANAAKQGQCNAKPHRTIYS